MVAEMEDYSGPQLDLDLFKKLMEGEMDVSELWWQQKHDHMSVCKISRYPVLNSPLLHDG